MLALRSLRSVRGSALRLAPLGAGALRPLATESYTDRMDKTGRPVSPHVTIYKFPVEALSSITTRITGVLLTIGTSAIGVASLGGAEVPALVAAFQSSAPVLVPAAKFVVVYPLSYHWLSALRHTVRSTCTSSCTLRAWASCRWKGACAALCFANRFMLRSSAFAAPPGHARSGGT